MKKFRVKLAERVTYLVDVEAKDFVEAGDLAHDLWAHSKDPEKEFGGEGHGVTVIFVKEDPPNWDPFT